MPFRTIRLQPGVNLEQTPTLNKTWLAASNLIRFYGGLVQKLGGWMRIASAALTGTCRGLHGWADIIGNAYLAAGTEQRLQLVIGGGIYDATPVQSTTNPAVSFTTASGSASVTVSDAGYSPSAGDWVVINTHVSVGGIVLWGFYQVKSSSSPTYVVQAASNATANVAAGGAVALYATTNGSAAVSVTLANHGLSTNATYTASISTAIAGLTISGAYSVTSVTNSSVFVITALGIANATTSVSENRGNAQFAYFLPTGYAVNTPLLGYGTGDYGSGDYGLAGTSAATGLLRQWSLDHFGQYLVASPSNLGIYYWMPPSPQPASVMTYAPLYNAAVFVIAQSQIIVALGAEISGTQQPLLVRWSNAGSFSNATDWTATATNQAGSFFLPSGTRLVGGLSTGLGAIIWTDTDCWTMTYLGFPLVFGFNVISRACGLISQRAAGGWANQVMWLSTRGFFIYGQGGGVTPVECPVWDFLFNNLDQSQLQQVHCAVNALFNEACWHFPLAQSSALYTAGAPMAYVKYNYIENAWDYGLSAQYQRTSWTGVSPSRNPIGADLNGLLQEHEIGSDADGAGMAWSWQTGFFDLSEGEDFIFSDYLIPDFVTVGSPYIAPMLMVTDYPYAAPTAIVAPPITASSNFITYNARGRQMSVGMSGSDLGTFNRIGAIRVRYAPDGRPG